MKSGEEDEYEPLELSTNLLNSEALTGELVPQRTALCGLALTGRALHSRTLVAAAYRPIPVPLATRRETASDDLQVLLHVVIYLSWCRKRLRGYRAYGEEPCDDRDQ